jgi:hypothetical protein
LQERTLADLALSAHTSIEELACRVTRKETSIDVLQPELMDQYCPIVRLIDQSLQASNGRGELMLPELRRDGNVSIGMFCDFGGESADSHYQTYSFLAFGWNHSFHFQEEVSRVKTAHGLSSGTEIKYERLNHDGRLERCLPDYLRLADWLPGFLLTVVVDKEITSLFGPPGPQTEIMLRDELKKIGICINRPHIVEKLLRVAHPAAYLVALLSNEGQNIFWFPDDDAISPNKDRGQGTALLFQSLLNAYGRKAYGTFGWATPTLIEQPDRLCNLLSLTDLAAGSVERFMSNRKTAGNVRLKTQAELVLHWLGHQGLGLKKHTVHISLADQQHLTISELKFGPREMPRDAQLVHIPVRRA